MILYIYYGIIWYRYSGLSYVFKHIPSWGSPFTRRYLFLGGGIFQSVSAQQTKPRWGREHESCDITCHNQTRESQSPTKWRLGWSTNLVDDSRGIDNNKPRHRRDFHWDKPLSEQRLLAIPCCTWGALRQERLRQTYTLTAIWKALKSDIGMDWHLHQTSTVESGTFKLRIGYAEIWFSIMNPHFLRTNPPICLVVSTGQFSRASCRCRQFGTGAQYVPSFFKHVGSLSPNHLW